MALIDDPRAWILRLFEREEHEGRGADCQRFEKGCRPNGIPLSDGEFVYGIYKNKYHFTPIALVIRNQDKLDRICWADVKSCSTRHGEGAKVSDVALCDGTHIKVQLHEFGKGWSGKMSQLFHQMIERYGNKAGLGKPLVPADEFFNKADDPYCIAPNLEPHPSLEEFRTAIEELAPSTSGARVFFSMVDDEGEFAAEEIIFVTPRAGSEFDDFVTRFHADGWLSADENTLRKIGDVPFGFNVWRIIWD